jgi:thioredoxin reductase
MRYLRSPRVHHLDIDPWSLQAFERTESGKLFADFIEPYHRPSLSLFQAHASRIIRENGLDQLRIKGRALRIRALRETIRVEIDNGLIEARRIILAIGMSEQPCWPAWAQELQKMGAPVNHVFDPSFNREDLSDSIHTCVVGGGITAAQTALSLAQDSPGKVSLLSRHEIRVQQFDSNPCYLGPRCITPFLQIRNYTQRRETISRERYGGSMPPYVADELRKAIANANVEFHMGKIARACISSSGDVQLILGDGNRLVRAEQLVLATGFDPTRPGGEMIDKAIQDFNLPCAPCGYPIVDEYLRWHPGIFVTGPLAELEIGPASRNIAGARKSGERIISAPEG